MTQTDTIASAELRFRQSLEEFFISIYDEKSLSSHGINHHRRVWAYAKTILTIFSDHDRSLIPRLSSQLLIASYLHDIGMHLDKGFRHGRYSREFCVQFLNKNNLPEKEFQDVLFAVENHDNKDYSGNNNVNDLLRILSVADDLDAYGFTGIFRYTEIYLSRDIEPQKIGFMILENAEKRYENFSNIFKPYYDFVQQHKKRYDILDLFFKEYNRQSGSYPFDSVEPSGHCGVVDIIHKAVQKKETFDNVLRKTKNQSQDKVIRWFADGLLRETEQGQ